MFWQKVDYTKSRQLLNLTRPQIGYMVQMLSGHNHLRRHRVEVLKEPDKIQCRLCESSKESTEHLFLECTSPELVSRRLTCFGTTTPDADLVSKAGLSVMHCFLNEALSLMGLVLE